MGEGRRVMHKLLNAREANYDLLRCLCVWAVIINHVSDVTLYWHGSHQVVSFIWEGLGAYAVPCFLMITGAIAVNAPGNSDFKRYWSKSYRKVGIQTVLFSLFYFFWYTFTRYRHSGDIADAVQMPINMQLSGWHGHPLWYVYTLLGIYLFIPLICTLKNRYGHRIEYHICALGYVAWALLSMYLEQAMISWSVDYVFHLLGFVVLGSEIKTLVSKRNNLHGYALIAGGVILSIAMYLLLYQHVLHGGNYRTAIFNDMASPLSVCTYVLIFSGVTMLALYNSFPLTVKYSFYVYLIHKFVLEILDHSIKIDGIMDQRVIYIPVMVVLVYGCSLVLAVLYDRAYRKVSCWCSRWFRYLEGALGSEK